MFLMTTSEGLRTRRAQSCWTGQGRCVPSRGGPWSWTEADDTNRSCLVSAANGRAFQVEPVMTALLPWRIHSGAMRGGELAGAEGALLAVVDTFDGGPVSLKPA